MSYLELQPTFWSWNTIRCRWVCTDRSQHLEDSSNVQIISGMLHQLWDPREEYLENDRSIDGCQKLNTSTKSVYLMQLSVISKKFIPDLSIDEKISLWGNRMLYSFLLHQFRVEKWERQLDDWDKQVNHHCSQDFWEESITEAKGSILLGLYPLWSFESFEYFAINFLNLLQ